MRPGDGRGRDDRSRFRQRTGRGQDEQRERGHHVVAGCTGSQPERSAGRPAAAAAAAAAPVVRHVGHTGGTHCRRRAAAAAVGQVPIPAAAAAAAGQLQQASVAADGRRAGKRVRRRSGQHARRADRSWWQEEDLIDGVAPRPPKVIILCVRHRADGKPVRRIYNILYTHSKYLILVSTTCHITVNT